MGNSIEARNIVKTLLNTSLVDPNSTFRKGLHFFDEGTDLNLIRDMPKGYIKLDTPARRHDGIGNTGHSDKSVNIQIWYFVKEGQKYDDGTTVYKSKELASYMIEKISDLLLDNRILGSDYHIKAFGDSQGPQTDANNIHFDVLPVTIYWDDIYG